MIKYLLLTIHLIGLILLTSCQEENPIRTSILDDADPISKVLNDYIESTSGSRALSQHVLVTNVEKRVYNTSDFSLGNETATRASGNEEFDVIRTDFITPEGTEGYAYLSTHDKAGGVYYYTDNGHIADSVDNKGLAHLIALIPEAVGSSILDTTKYQPNLPDLPSEPMPIGTSPLIKTK